MAGMGLVAIVGGPVVGAAASLLQVVLGLPAANRRRAWEEQVTIVLRWLMGAGRTTEQLCTDEMIDAVFRASQIAGADSTETKRRALMNALCNVGVGSSPSRDRQSVMMRLLDEVTELHIRTLGFLVRREALELIHGEPPEFDEVPGLLVAKVLDFRDSPDLAEAVTQELIAMGLLNDIIETGVDGGSAANGGSSGLFAAGKPWVPGASLTKKAKDFAAFISGPFDPHEQPSRESDNGR